MWWATLPNKIKQLPYGVFIVGIILQTTLLITFVVLAAFEYHNNITTQYISPEQDNSLCYMPPKSLTGSYYLSSSGIWSSKTAFSALEV